MKNKLNHIINQEISKLFEGVADTYGEKFGLPNPAKEMDRKATAGIPPTPSMGKYIGDVEDENNLNLFYDDNEGPVNAKLSRVFMNPESLQKFEPNTRAISDEGGNLFVAETDGMFYHVNLEHVIMNNFYYSGGEFIQWYRIGSANSFRISNTYGSSNAPLGREEEIQYITKLRERQPQFKFTNLGVSKTIVREEIQSLNEEIKNNVLKMLNENSEYNFTEEDLDNCWQYYKSYLIDILNGDYDLNTAREDLQSLIGSKFDKRTNIVGEEIEKHILMLGSGGIDEEISEFNKSVFTELPEELYQKLRLRKFSDAANRSHMKLYKAKDGKDYVVKKEINQDIFRVYRLDNLNFDVATAVFDDDKPEYFTGYENRQSIKVEPEYRRLGLATAITDFAETIYNKPYKPSEVLSEPMQGFVGNRFK